MPTKLTDGERALASFLDDYLPGEYRIYVQPVINGLKPDVIVVNPNWGLVVFEVKDWTLGRYRWEGDQLIGQTTGPPWTERDPRSQARHYSQQLFRQFLGVEEASRRVEDETNEFRICLPAIYIHGPSAEEVEKLFGAHEFGDGKTNIVLHRENISAALSVPWTKYRLSRSKFLTERQSEALLGLHRWLQPIANQATTLPSKPLTAQQQRLAEPGFGDYRIRGVAGSGKSLVLARRAAKASREGPIIVTCFNITMAHVLRDLMAKCGEPIDWKNVTVRHFHGLMKDLAVEAGLLGSNQPFDFDSTVERATLRSIEGIAAYRGIYIDEGQDFEAAWVDCLAALKDQHGELVFMADYRQGLYDRVNAADGRKLRNARFHEGWRELNKTFRLPWRVALVLNELAATASLGDENDPALSDYEPRPPQTSMLEDLSWSNLGTLDEALAQMNQLLRDSPAQPSDIVVLVRSHQTGECVVRSAESADIRFVPIQHVFGPDGPDSEESKRRKHAFWMGRGNLKACTVHSFKGWELNNVIVLWDGSEIGKKDLSELYVALSRAYYSLHVLNVNRAFDTFSQLDAWNA